MEDMARLAVFEQNSRDVKLFSETLKKLLEYISFILENPHDYETRTIKSDLLNDSLKIEGFVDYLKYIGFVVNEKELVYPKEMGLSRLKLAQAGIQRKLHFTYGSVDVMPNVKTSQTSLKPNKTRLMPVHVLRTNNTFLMSVQAMFNDILKYEDEEMLQLARQHMPMVTLQIKALERMREQQKKIKSGQSKDQDIPYESALLMELVCWFKYSFFKWMDSPACDTCSGDTVFERSETRNGILVEIYRCAPCNATTPFPRYKNLRDLLRSRRGRCGEWADCFALFLRALNYDTRHVYDTTDHVWCEVYDHESHRWVHVDPCEGCLDAPLIYEHGWGKKLQYVIAVSRDDLQDVTWRYTSHHQDILTRRKLCREKDLVTTIMQLREQRHHQVTDARRKFLIKRNLEELAQLMVEKKPSDYEGHGRISGSQKWRTERGEIGKSNHTFEITEPGCYIISYTTSTDRYAVIKDGRDVRNVDTWCAGAYQLENMFRKEEKDWKMVYLARTENETKGRISWRISAKEGLVLSNCHVRAITKLYHDGELSWTTQCDSLDTQPMNIDEDEIQCCKDFILTATLDGGIGDVAWQHSQLGRQSTKDKTPTIQIMFNCKKDE